jgi:tryptophan synthase beta chain
MITKESIKSSFSVSQKGYYGRFGGAYIPEMLYPNVEELRENYLKIINQADFQEDFHNLLRDYVGRPTPLYFANRLPENTKLMFISNEKTFAIREPIK